VSADHLDRARATPRRRPYWIFRPERWDRAFDGSWLWPLLGVLFLPVTTIVWVLVSPGGVASFDFLWLGIAVFLDLGSTARSAAKRNG
jgi:hypothetical protein